MNNTELLPVAEDTTDSTSGPLTPVDDIPSGLPRADGVAIWGAFQSDIERLKATSATITIRDSQDTHGMKLVDRGFNTAGLIKQFSNTEGFPPLDGTWDIEIVDVDPFDYCEITIEES